MSVVSNASVNQLSSTMGALMQPSLYEPHVAPKQVPKIGHSAAAEEYLMRNRGSLQLKHDDRVNSECLSSRGPRVLGSGAENWRQANGSVGMILFPSASSAAAGGNQRNFDSSANVAVPRVKGSDGEEILRKSHGTMSKLLNTVENRSYSSPRPAPRLPTEAAETNADKGRGTMDKVLDHKSNVSASYSWSTLDAHKPSAGERNAMYGRVQMTTVLEQPVALGVGQNFNSREPVCRPPSALASNTPRVADGSARNRGQNFHKALTGQLPGTPPGEVRIKGDKGRQNYEHGTNGKVGDLLKKASVPPEPNEIARPASRVNGRGTDIADYGKTGTLHRLLNDYGRLPQSCRPEPRVKSAGRHYAYVGRGKTMADHINPSKMPAKRPTRRKLGLTKNTRPNTACPAAFGSCADRGLAPPSSNSAAKSRPSAERPQSAPPVAN